MAFSSIASDFKSTHSWLEANNSAIESAKDKDPSPKAPLAGPPKSIVDRFAAAGMLDADCRLIKTSTAFQLPCLSQERKEKIEQLLSQSLEFEIPFKDKFFKLSFTMKEFLQELLAACKDNNIKVEGVLIIGGAVPWILGPEYCMALLESLVSGSTAGLSEEDLQFIRNLPNDVDFRFIISTDNKEHIPLLKNRIIAYLSAKLPPHFSQREREDMITSKKSIFQEFQPTTLWDQKKRQIDIDYFIFGIKDAFPKENLPAKYEVSLARLLRRPYLFSSQNVSLDIQSFLSASAQEIELKPQSLFHPDDPWEAAQAIFEKLAHIFHIPEPEKVDKKGILHCCSQFVKRAHCLDASALPILHATTKEYCVQEAKDPCQKAGSPLDVLVQLLKTTIDKHHERNWEDGLALLFNFCATAGEVWTQEECALLWKAVAKELGLPAKHLFPLPVFSRAMTNPAFSFEVLAALVDLQGFFYLCSPWCNKSSALQAHLIKNEGKYALQFVEKNRGWLLPFQPLESLLKIEKKLAELCHAGDLAALSELENVQRAFSLPPDSLQEAPAILGMELADAIPFPQMELIAQRMLQQGNDAAKKLAFQLLLALQIIRPEKEKENLIVRCMPAALALEKTRHARLERLRWATKALSSFSSPEAYPCLEISLDAIHSLLKDPNIEQAQIVSEWVLHLAPAAHFHKDVFFFWKQYQSLIQGKNDVLTEPLIQKLLSSNVALAAELLARIPHDVSIEKKIALFCALFSNQKELRSPLKGILDWEFIARLSIRILSLVPPDRQLEKDKLAKTVAELVKESLARKQLAHAKELLLAEEKKRLFGTKDAAGFWARLCNDMLKSMDQGIIPALEIYQEAASLGIWNEHKPRGLILQLIEELYKQTDPCHWHQADALLVELCSDALPTDEKRKAAVHMLINKKERALSLKQSPHYTKLQTFFHPAERMNILQAALQEYIAQANMQKVLFSLNEIMEIAPLPDAFADDIGRVCRFLEQSKTDPIDYQEFIKVLFHPNTLKLFARNERFPFNFAITFCHALRSRGILLADAVVINLVSLCQAAPKKAILAANRLHLANIVASKNPDTWKNYPGQQTFVCACLKEGGRFEALCECALFWKKAQIGMDETNACIDLVAWALQKCLESPSGRSARLAFEIAQTFSLEDPRYRKLMEPLKGGLMGALLKTKLYAEASVWVQFIGQRPALFPLSSASFSEWIPLLIEGQQYNAAAELLKGAFKCSNDSKNTCARLWLDFPKKMYDDHKQVGYKACIQANKEMLPELHPVACRLLSAYIESKLETSSIENMLTLLERYAVTDPHLWQRVFSVVETQSGKENKARNRLLPLLTLMAEPAGFLQNDPEARTSCWLSALRTYFPSSHEPLGEAWKPLLENVDEFSKLFPFTNPETAAEALSLLLEIWIAHLPKQSDDLDLLQRLLPIEEDVLKSKLLDDPRMKEYKQKIYLQIIRGGCSTINYQVFFQTVHLLESLLIYAGTAANISMQEAEYCKAIKKVFSCMVEVMHNTPTGFFPIFEGSLTNILRLASNIFSDECVLEIIEHVLNLDKFFRVFAWEALNYFERRLNKLNKSTATESLLTPKVQTQMARSTHVLLEKIENIVDAEKQNNTGIPVSILMQYSRFCENPALLQFVKPKQQQAAFQLLPKMMASNLKSNNSDERAVMLQYIMSGFPYNKVNSDCKGLFFLQIMEMLLINLTRNRDMPQFREDFEKVLKKYGLCLPTQKLIPAGKEKPGRWLPFILLQILDASTNLKNVFDMSAGLQSLLEEEGQGDKDLEKDLSETYGQAIEYLYYSAVSIFNMVAFSDQSFHSDAIVKIIDKLLENPMALAEKTQTSNFKVFLLCFDLFRKKNAYKGFEHAYVYHGLLLGYVLDDKWLSESPYALMALQTMLRIQEWAKKSEQPLCLYRMLRILQCNQNVFYARHPNQLVRDYRRAADAVFKTPFYPIPFADREQPDLLYKSILGENIPMALQDRLNYVKDNGTSANELYLCEALIESFLGVDLAIFYAHGVNGEDCYREIWNTLFKAILGALDKSMKNTLHSQGYARIVELLHDLIQQAGYAKALAEQRDKTSGSFTQNDVKISFERKPLPMPSLTETSPASAFLELISEIASFIKDLTSIQQKIEAKEDISAYLEKDQLYFHGFNDSKISHVTSFEVSLNYTCKVVAPTYLIFLLNKLKENRGCTPEEKIDIYNKIDEQILAALFSEKRIWSHILQNFCYWHFDEICCARNQFTGNAVHMQKYLGHILAFCSRTRSEKVFSAKNSAYLHSLEDYFLLVLNKLKSGNIPETEFISIASLVAWPNNEPARLG